MSSVFSHWSWYAYHSSRSLVATHTHIHTHTHTHTQTYMYMYIICTHACTLIVFHILSVCIIPYLLYSLDQLILSFSLSLPPSLFLFPSFPSLSLSYSLSLSHPSHIPPLPPLPPQLVYVSGTLKVAGSEPFLACTVRPVSPPAVLELRMEGNMFVAHYSMANMSCIYFDGR